MNFTEIIFVSLILLLVLHIFNKRADTLLLLLFPLFFQFTKLASIIYIDIYGPIDVMESLAIKLGIKNGSLNISLTLILFLIPSAIILAKKENQKLKINKYSKTESIFFLSLLFLTIVIIYLDAIYADNFPLINKDLRFNYNYYLFDFHKLTDKFIFLIAFIAGAIFVSNSRNKIVIYTNLVFITLLFIYFILFSHRFSVFFRFSCFFILGIYPFIYTLIKRKNFIEKLNFFIKTSLIITIPVVILIFINLNFINLSSYGVLNKFKERVLINPSETYSFLNDRDQFRNVFSFNKTLFSVNGNPSIDYITNKIDKNNNLRLQNKQLAGGYPEIFLITLGKNLTYIIILLFSIIYILIAKKIRNLVLSKEYLISAFFIYFFYSMSLFYVSGFFQFIFNYLFWVKVLFAFAFEYFYKKYRDSTFMFLNRCLKKIEKI
ncbi:hypothetical protein MCEME18_00238 [Candidatus Pelagibacterales bacterium]